MKTPKIPLPKKWISFQSERHMKNAGTVMIFAGVGMLVFFNALLGAGLIVFGIGAIVVDVFGGGGKKY